MERTIRFDENDIRKIIAERFHLTENKLKFYYEGTSSPNLKDHKAIVYMTENVELADFELEQEEKMRSRI